jgi:tetratricopeptide (TPR) repeat protein
MITDSLVQIHQKQDEARSYRKKGDALRKAGEDAAAREAYRDGLQVLDAALKLLEVDEISVADQQPSGELGTVLGELVETFGARGGMLQRLGEVKEASESYSQGALLEEKYHLPSTYNRLNAIKYRLLAGNTPLRNLEPKIRDLANHIVSTLETNKSLSDSGWAWADLGDCLALLGDLDEARKAYATFVSKAEIKSPERTLDVLKQIASTLTAENDPEADRLQQGIDALQRELTGR